MGLYDDFYYKKNKIQHYKNSDLSKIMFYCPNIVLITTKMIGMWCFHVFFTIRDILSKNNQQIEIFKHIHNSTYDGLLLNVSKIVIIHNTAVMTNLNNLQNDLHWVGCFFMLDTGSCIQVDIVGTGNCCGTGTLKNSTVLQLAYDNGSTCTHVHMAFVDSCYYHTWFKICPKLLDLCS